MNKTTLNPNRKGAKHLPTIDETSNNQQYEETQDEIRTKVRDRFCLIATSPSREQKFPVGLESASRLGYDAHEIDSLPASVTESFSGVGNPLALGKLRVGNTIVDLGSGAGLDCILAARRVGPAGRVIGVDMTLEMIEKARRNTALLGVTNITFVHGEIISGKPYTGQCLAILFSRTAPGDPFAEGLGGMLE
jgi:protein-L-isoaspartate O-methyltransferase